jgi:prepilin-type N-terminal cleavage/methylation domain-containing protein
MLQTARTETPRQIANLIFESSKRKTWQRGLTLVELLVVLTIIATLAAIIYPAIIDSMKKSQAANRQSVCRDFQSSNVRG